MDDLIKFIQRNLRRIAAIAAIFISLLAISALSNSSPHSSMWIVKSSISQGARITAADVQLFQANVGSDAHHFASRSDAVIGRYATRLLVAGDLISMSDLSDHSSAVSASYLPIGVAVNDLPLDLSIGDRVDIYVIPKDQSVLPAVVARKVIIQSIDQKSRALGGSVGVSVSATDAVASVIVTAEAQGRLVIARDSF